MPETPLDPYYKKSRFFLDDAQIVGRKRTRPENIREGEVDFVSINERGEQIVALAPEAMALLESIDQSLKALHEHVLSRL